MISREEYIRNVPSMHSNKWTETNCRTSGRNVNYDTATFYLHQSVTFNST